MTNCSVARCWRQRRQLLLISKSYATQLSSHTINTVIRRTTVLCALEIAGTITFATNERSGHTLRIACASLRASLETCCVLVGEVTSVEVNSTTKCQSARAIGARAAIIFRAGKTGRAHLGSIWRWGRRSRDISGDNSYSNHVGTNDWVNLKSFEKQRRLTWAEPR